MNKCILTKEQTIELSNILSLLESSDLESISLGIGLLEDWPFNIRLYNSCTHQYSERLGYLLYYYETFEYFHYGYSSYFKKASIINFLRNLLENGEFYT